MSKSCSAKLGIISKNFPCIADHSTGRKAGVESAEMENKKLGDNPAVDVDFYGAAEENEGTKDEVKPCQKMQEYLKFYKGPVAPCGYPLLNQNSSSRGS